MTTYKRKLPLYEGKLIREFSVYSQSFGEVKGRQARGGKGIIYVNPHNQQKVVWEILKTPELPETEVINWSDKGPEECKFLKAGDIYPHWDGLNPINTSVEVELEIPDGWIKLEENNFLHQWFGKYAPGLLLISEIPEIVWEKVFPQTLNLNSGNYQRIRGDFFVTKKGKNAFKVNKEGKHFLVKDEWGGSFNKYRGDNLDKLSSLYLRRASSNGGGVGTDYTVIKIDSVYKISLEDL